MSYRSGNVSTFAVAAFVFVVFVYVSLAMLFKLNIFMSKQGCFKFQFLLSDLCWHHFHHQQKVSQQFLILDFCATTDNALRNYLLFHSLMHILRSKCHLVSYSILSKHYLVYFVNIVPPYLVRFVFILQIIRQLFLLSKIGLIKLTTF